MFFVPNKFFTIFRGAFAVHAIPRWENIRCETESIRNFVSFRFRNYIKRNRYIVSYNLKLYETKICIFSISRCSTIRNFACLPVRKITVYKTKFRMRFRETWEILQNTVSFASFRNFAITLCKIYSWRPPFTPPNPANFFFQSK